MLIACQALETREQWHILLSRSFLLLLILNGCRGLWVLMVSKYCSSMPQAKFHIYIFRLFSLELINNKLNGFISSKHFLKELFGQKCIFCHHLLAIMLRGVNSLFHQVDFWGISWTIFLNGVNRVEAVKILNETLCRSYDFGDWNWRLSVNIVAHSCCSSLNLVIQNGIFKLGSQDPQGDSREW